MKNSRRGYGALTQCCFAFLLLAGRPSIGASQQAPAGVPAAGRPTPCESGPDSQPLKRTLPLELLDYLEKISSSVFVQAFLIAHIEGEPTNPDGSVHPLVHCAKTFLNARPDQIVILQNATVEPALIIRELRAAERFRLDEQALLAEARLSLDSILPRLQANLGQASLPVYLETFQLTHDRSCNPAPAFCDPLNNVIARLNEAISNQASAKTARDAADVAATALADIQRQLPILRSQYVADSVALQLLDSIKPDQRTSEQLASHTALATSLPLSRQAFIALNESAGAARRSVDSISVVVQRATEAESRAMRELSATVTVLNNKLRSDTKQVVPAVPPTRDPVRTQVSHAPPPLAITRRGPSDDGSANIALQITDFVIDRAKQEVALSYLAYMYGQMRKNESLQSAFPGTYRLMSGLAVGEDKDRLSVVAAGRIGMPVWSSTLSTDFHRLPLNIASMDASRLCGLRPECIKGLEVARPVALIAGRLLKGDPVFEVLRDAPLIAAELGTKLPQEWGPFLQGLQMVATLVESYQVQGFALTADPVDHPYILSLSALSVVPSKQLDGFVRLLMLEAPGSAAVRSGTNANRFVDAARRATGAVESIATALQAPPANGERSRQVSAAAVSAIEVADEIATLFTDSTSRAAAIRRNLIAAVGPLAARDYSLAMSRTVVLMESLSSGPVSRNMLTLSSLASGLADARTEAEVRSALEAAASPVGGWQAKRYREGRRASITAFPGFSAGLEWLYRSDRRVGTAGVALPIGPEYQILSRSEDDGGLSACFIACSVGVFVPLVDLGALLNYRLKDSPDVATEPNAEFRQVFAPGVYLSLGLGRSAFALMAGGQFMPSLRTVDVGASKQTRNAWRLGVALVMDVMLLEF